MMADRRELDDVLNEFFAEIEMKGPGVLTRYIDQHPEFETDLHEAAGFFRATEEIPDFAYSADYEDLLSARTASLVQNALFTLYHAEPDAGTKKSLAEIPDLFAAVRSHGETPKSFAQTLRVSPVIVSMLNARDIKPESIPRKMFDLIATALAIDVASIVAYTYQARVPSPSHYKADAAPEVMQAEFASLVIKDPLMSDEDKGYWLAELPKK